MPHRVIPLVVLHKQVHCTGMLHKQVHCKEMLWAGPGCSAGLAVEMRKRLWVEAAGLLERRLLLALPVWVASHHWSVVVPVAGAAHLRRWAALGLMGVPCPVVQHHSSAVGRLAGPARVLQGTTQLRGAHIPHRRWEVPLYSREAGSPVAKPLVGMLLHMAVPTLCRLEDPSPHALLARQICQVDRQVVQLHMGAIT